MESISGKVRDKALEKHTWNTAGNECPYNTNRGFCYGDEHCLKCSERERCQIPTQRRILAILHGFQNIPFVWQDGEQYEQYEQFDDRSFLEASKEHLGVEWFKEKREAIRQAANDAIKEQIDPEDLHPNTRRYFQNCFPEWNEYERWRIQSKLRDDMESFYTQECEHSFNYRYYWRAANYEIDDIDSEQKVLDREEFLAATGDWRGFPFEDLFGGNDNIPAKTRKRFAQDYFAHVQQTLQTQKDAAKLLGFFGKRAKTERWPRNWMMENKQIKKFIESKKGKFFIELLKYLESRRMKMREGEQIARKLGYGKKKFVCVQVNREKAAQFLSKRKELDGISVSAHKVYRFLKWMNDYGLIKKLGQPGPRANSVYAIGKWFSFPDPITGEMQLGGYSSFVKKNKKKALVKAIKVKL